MWILTVWMIAMAQPLPAQQCETDQECAEMHGTDGSYGNEEGCD